MGRKVTCTWAPYNPMNCVLVFTSVPVPSVYTGTGYLPHNLSNRIATWLLPTTKPRSVASMHFEAEKEKDLFRTRLLSSMRYDHAETARVQCRGFSVQIGSDPTIWMRVMGPYDVLNLEDDKTLVLTYGEGMRMAKVSRKGPMEQILVAEGYPSFCYGYPSHGLRRQL